MKNRFSNFFACLCESIKRVRKFFEKKQQLFLLTAVDRGFEGNSSLNVNKQFTVFFTVFDPGNQPICLSLKITDYLPGA